MRPAIAGTTAKNLSGIQSRETAKKDSDEEAARRDSAEDLTGGGSAALTDRPDNQSGVTAKKRLIDFLSQRSKVHGVADRPERSAGKKGQRLDKD